MITNNIKRAEAENERIAAENGRLGNQPHTACVEQHGLGKALREFLEKRKNKAL